MNKTPDHQLPTIRESTTVGIRLPIAAWWGIIVVLVVGSFGAGGWATWMSIVVSQVQADVAEIRAELKERDHKITKANP